MITALAAQFIIISMYFADVDARNPWRDVLQGAFGLLVLIAIGVAALIIMIRRKKTK